VSAPLDDLASYSAYVYTVAERHSIVAGSTLTLAPIGATLAKLEGRIVCHDGLHLEIWELIDFAAHHIRTYSYEVYRDGQKICWYDPWPHPEILALAATFPHHRHLPPDLRHHRVSSPNTHGMAGFVAPSQACQQPAAGASFRHATYRRADPQSDVATARRRPAR
jgi:hypothetical protein